MERFESFPLSPASLSHPFPLHAIDISWASKSIVRVLDLFSFYCESSVNGWGGAREGEKSFLSSGDLFVIWVWYHRLSDFFAVCEIRWAPKAPTRLAFSVGKLNLFTRAEPFALIDRQGWVCNLSVDVNAARWKVFIYQNMTGALITHEESEMWWA